MISFLDSQLVEHSEVIKPPKGNEFEFQKTPSMKRAPLMANKMRTIQLHSPSLLLIAETFTICINICHPSDPEKSILTYYGISNRPKTANTSESFTYFIFNQFSVHNSSVSNSQTDTKKGQIATILYRLVK